MKEGDYIVEIENQDVKWYSLEEVRLLIEATGNQLSLKLVTPMDEKYPKVRNSLLFDFSQTLFKILKMFCILFKFSSVEFYKSETGITVGLQPCVH